MSNKIKQFNDILYAIVEKNYKPRALNLRGYDLNDADMVRLTESLTSDTHILVCDLRENRLSENALTLLYNLVKNTNTTLSLIFFPEVNIIRSPERVRLIEAILLKRQPMLGQSMAEPKVQPSAPPAPQSGERYALYPAGHGAAVASAGVPSEGVFYPTVEDDMVSPEPIPLGATDIPVDRFIRDALQNAFNATPSSDNPEITVGSDRKGATVRSEKRDKLIKMLRSIMKEQGIIDSIPGHRAIAFSVIISRVLGQYMTHSPKRGYSRHVSIPSKDMGTIEADLRTSLSPFHAELVSDTAHNGAGLFSAPTIEAARAADLRLEPGH